MQDVHDVNTCHPIAMTRNVGRAMNIVARTKPGVVPAGSIDRWGH